jgi:hypothetical protein
MRYVRFRRHLCELLADANSPKLVAYEEVRRHLGVDAAHAYGGYLAILQEECSPCLMCNGAGVVKSEISKGFVTCPDCCGINSKGIEYTGIPVGTVKKTATGRGNASKEDMMAAARARWPGWEPVDDNESDARFVAVAAAGEVKGE